MAKRFRFSDRLNEACDRHPDAPSDHGRQAWVRKGLEKLGHDVTAQGVSNWFSDRSTPRPDLLSAIALLLNVNPGWLLGHANDATREDESQSATKMAAGSTVHALPIRIRPDLTVTVQNLPLDLSETEAKRLANVILALAI